METDRKIILTRIIVGVALLVASFLFHGQYTKIIFCAAAYITVGVDVVYKAFRGIFKGELFDENFLMSIASIGAFVIGEYPEAVAVMLFYQVGEMFQDIAVDRTRASIAALMDIRPEHANIVNDAGELVQVAPESVASGSIIVVKPGEKIPLDGVVVSGSSSLDTAALTGESKLRDVAENDEVISGSLNMTGVLRVRTSGGYSESTVAKILELVEHADSGKARTERFITRFARLYTPIVVVAAILVCTLPPLLFGGDWSAWINRGLIFLVISCPCALVVSVPLTFFAGIGGASTKGILIKGSNNLEILSKIRTIIFDKTGTLTNGSFTVTEVHSAVSTRSDKTLLEVAALAECYSDHPVSASLRDACGKRLDKARVTDTENFAGEGIRATVDGMIVYAGNIRLMRRAGLDIEEIACRYTLIYIAIDGEFAGHIILEDTIKPQSAEAIATLKREGVAKTVMLSGDLKEVADAVSLKLGIDETHAELLPVDKVDWLRKIQKEGEKVAFVGDGINDAPVLKMSDVGIAMGGAGSQAAIGAADVVLMDDNPVKIAHSIRFARKTIRIVYQNIHIAIGVKMLVLILDMFGVANMWEAVFADVGVTVIAVANAMRAMYMKER